MNPQSIPDGTRYGLNIQDAVDSSERPWRFMLGKNLGNETLLLCLPFEDFLGKSFIPNESNIKAAPGRGEEAMAQRPLSLPHATSLGRFVLKGILKQLKKEYQKEGAPVPKALEDLIRVAGPQPYMALQPVVANLRKFKTPDLRFNADGTEVFLGNRHTLYVIDGQHRHKGMEMVRDYVSDILLNLTYPKKPDLLPELFSPAEEGLESQENRLVSPEEVDIWSKVREGFHANCTVMLEVHLGLNSDEERQLFHDLNNLSKKVEISMAQEFDQSNPINLYIRNHLGKGKGVLEVDIKPSDKKSDVYDGSFSLKEITAINAILFLNRFNTKSAVPSKVERFHGKADEFWRMVNGIPGVTDPGFKTVASQPVILKALANLYYLFSEGKISKKSSWDLKAAREEQRKNLLKLVDGIRGGKIDFAHDNPMWRYYSLSDAEKREFRFINAEGMTLAEYLPGEDKEVPVIGAYDARSKTMKFATQHNSIFPILGDMIRWNLCLPVKTRRNTDNKKKRRR